MAEKKTESTQPEPITITAYARHRKQKGLKGGTHQAVKKAIDSARLLKTVVKVGKKNMITDPEAADIEWSSKTTPETQIDQNQPEQDELNLEDRETGRKYTSARARRQEAQAELAEIELAKAKGEVLDLVAARKQLTTIGNEISQAFKNITRAHAADLAAETNPQAMRIKLQDLLKNIALKAINQLEKVMPNG